MNSFDANPQLDFDEGWYLDRYSDVAKAVFAGQWRSAFEHYIEYGRLERRFPNKRASIFKRVFAYGSFGSNNVGDEAILEGLRRCYPDCIQIYQNSPRNGKAIYPIEILSKNDFFGPEDLLVVGGGGLLYDRPTVKLMADLAEAAARAGATVDILGLGCEAAQEPYYDEIRRLFSYASNVTLRSTESQKIIKSITGIIFPAKPDLAYNLQFECSQLPQNKRDRISIGVVTASSNMTEQGEVRAVAEIIKRYIHDVKEDISFVHIPHSRSHFNFANNDCVSGEIIWSLSCVHNARYSDSFVNASYKDDPLVCLSTYAGLDGVISYRYHGLIFGTMMNIPTLAVGARLPKIRSFVDDRPDLRNLVSADTGGQLSTKFPEFLTLVKEWRRADSDLRSAA